MSDLGLISCSEPFKKLLTQGMVVKDGNKMSKSKGNTVSPDDMIDKYGSDTARLFMLFASPPPMDLEWSDDGVEGASRFLNSVWRKITGGFSILNFQFSIEGVKPEGLTPDGKKLLRKAHQTIKKVTNDIGKEQQFNTAVAALMELFNEFNAANLDLAKKEDAELFMFVSRSMILMMAPLVPHFSEELWEMAGGKPSIFTQKWPEYDQALTVEDSVEFVIQVSGKIRERLQMPVNTKQEDVEKAALASPKVLEWTNGKEIVKKIFVANKLLNIVVK